MLYLGSATMDSPDVSCARPSPISGSMVYETVAFHNYAVLKQF
jgi:hypothetical protein